MSETNITPHPTTDPAEDATIADATNVHDEALPTREAAASIDALNLVPGADPVQHGSDIDGNWRPR